MLRFKVYLCIILMAIALTANAAVAWTKDTFRIVQLTDSHIAPGSWHNDYLKSAIDEINSSSTDYDLVISTGDITNTGVTDEYLAYKDLTLKLKLPIYHAIGNHEVRWSNLGKVGYQQLINKSLYYSFNHKRVHFVSLDSTTYLEHSSIIDPQQLEWLEKDLKQTGTNTPVVLYYHHCPNYLQNEAALLNVIKDYNVKIALVGHEHTWNSFIRNGTYFQLTAATYEYGGAYRIIEFDKDEIKTYRKEVGKDAVLDGKISIAKVKNPVNLISPKQNKQLSGSFEVIAKTSAPMAKVEIGIDDQYKRATDIGNGLYQLNFDADIIPGRHLVMVRGTDKNGAEWLQSAAVTIGDMSRELWRFKTKGAAQGTPTIKDGKVFFGTWGGDVFCIDSKTGKQIWKKNTGADVISQIEIESGTAFFSITNGYFVAVNAQNGKTIWKTRLGDTITSSPLVNNGVVYTSSSNSYLYALDTATGKELWKAATLDFAEAKPLLLNGKIYIGSWGARFFCFDAKTGGQVWALPIGTGWKGWSPAYGDPVTDGKNVIFTTIPSQANDPDILCVDPNTGSTIWKFQTAPGESGCSLNSPCASKDKVYAVTAETKKLFCISAADGKVAWTADTNQGSVTNEPALNNGKIYTCGTRGIVSSFDAQTGKKHWSYSTGSSDIFGTAAFDNERIFISSMDGYLICMKEDNP